MIGSVGAPGDALELAATALDDLALSLMTTSENNPEGNSLTAAIVVKCAEIVRQHKYLAGVRS